MNTIIKTQNISKWYGKVLGISDISIEINSGIKGLLGPNGAGKSTFLRIIGGQIKPNAGKVSVFNKDISKDYNIFKKIGYCPEYDSFYGEITGYEFIYYLLKFHGFKHKEAKEKAITAVENVGLSDKKNNKIKTYSMGMRQRIKLAQCFSHDPELILLDEPLKGVDPIWRINIIKMIKKFKEQGKTIIISSHILPEIEAMTNDIILINQGKIFAEGSINFIRDLLDTHPHIINIKSQNERKLASLLINDLSILNIDFHNDGISVKTNNRDIFFKNLSNIIVNNNFNITEITSPDDNLQAVFDYLIGK